jgi:hypothetical protein
MCEQLRVHNNTIYITGSDMIQMSTLYHQIWTKEKH